MTHKSDKSYLINIVIIGAGQLGSRYLQGLSQSEYPLAITVVDYNSNSLGVAQQRWTEAGGNESHHIISWHSRLDTDLEPALLAIVSTPSFKRTELIQSVANVFRPQYWILEKLLTQSADELNCIKSVIGESSVAWVNTPRRLMRWHQKLREQYKDEGTLDVKIIGGLWGLACNAIHFIDLICWWTGESLVSITTDSLDDNWFESKRPGYFEITGELVAFFSNNSKLSLSSNTKNITLSMHVKTERGNEWIIDEISGIASGSCGAQIAGRVEYQSEMTGPLVTQILKDGICGLPTLDESAAQHSVLLQALIEHWNRFNNRQDTAVPIT